MGFVRGIGVWGRFVWLSEWFVKRYEKVRYVWGKRLVYVELFSIGRV